MKAGESYIIRCHTFWGHFCKSRRITTLSSGNCGQPRDIFCNYNYYYATELNLKLLLPLRFAFIRLFLCCVVAGCELIRFAKRQNHE